MVQHMFVYESCGPACTLQTSCFNATTAHSPVVFVLTSLTFHLLTLAAILSTASSNVLQIGGLNPPPATPPKSEASYDQQEHQGDTAASSDASDLTLLDSLMEGVSSNGNGKGSTNTKDRSRSSSGRDINRNGTGEKPNPATVSQAAEAANNWVQQLPLARQKGIGSAAMVWRTVRAWAHSV